MSEMLRFDGRVVVITGAGSGLGKAYALEFGKRGAKVVVNDLGGSRSGEGQSSKAADLVVEEITKAGGIAVANYDSVEFGDKVIETAITNFGRIDIVVNNAGILRDSSFLKMKEADWDLIMKIHLKGAFSVTKAAWPYMKKQKFGRIINTSSGSGLYGNFGQANYSSAKLGLHGMSQTLAKEGHKYNIRVNSIAPVAASRMTQDMFAPEILETLTPDKIVPLVVYLTHESCNENGAVFELAGGWVTRVRWQRARGVFFPETLTAEVLRDNWNQVNSFEEGADYPTSLTDSLQKVMKLIEEKKPKL